MDRRTLAYGALVGGIGLVLISALADQLGIGSEPATFGYLQSLGVVLGAAAVLVGVSGLQRSR